MSHGAWDLSPSSEMKEVVGSPLLLPVRFSASVGPRASDFSDVIAVRRRKKMAGKQSGRKGEDVEGRNIREEETRGEAPGHCDHS